MNNKIYCFSCKALVPDIQGATHRYILSSPGCWYLYGQLLIRDYNHTYDSYYHSISVDTYAISHPGNKETVSIQSVNLHLLRMYYIYENNISKNEIENTIKYIKKKLNNNYIYFYPPEFDNTIHITDVLEIQDLDLYKKMIYKWGESVWNVWYSKYKKDIDILIQKINI